MRRNAALIGIGGSRADEWPVFIERLLYSYAPSAVVLNLGTNDLGRSESAQTAASELQTLFEELHKAMPDCEICWYTLGASARYDGAGRRDPCRKRGDEILGTGEGMVHTA